MPSWTGNNNNNTINFTNYIPPGSQGPRPHATWNAVGRGRNDTITGGHNSDTIYGDFADPNNLNSGNDRLFGGQGLDWIHAARGNDHVDGGEGADTLIGGPGTTFPPGEQPQVVPQGVIPQSLPQLLRRNVAVPINPIDIVPVNSLPGVITLPELIAVPPPDNDLMFGGAGNDAMDGGIGNDKLFGGVDNDSLYGSAGDDYLSGDAGRDVMIGGLGNDTLLGGLDNDTLNGFGGNPNNFNAPAEIDKLAGGAGADWFILGNTTGVFYFESGVGHAIVQDWRPLQGDRIQLATTARVGGRYSVERINVGSSDNVGNAAIADTAIVYTNGSGTRDWIGILQDVTISNLNQGFVFV